MKPNSQPVDITNNLLTCCLGFLNFVWLNCLMVNQFCRKKCLQQESLWQRWLWWNYLESALPNQSLDQRSWGKNTLIPLCSLPHQLPPSLSLFSPSRSLLLVQCFPLTEPNFKAEGKGAHCWSSWRSASGAQSRVGKFTQWFLRGKRQLSTS